MTRVRSSGVAKEDEISAKDYYEYLKRYSVEESIRYIAIQSRNMFINGILKKTEDLSLYNEWAMAFMAKGIILSSNDHKRRCLNVAEFEKSLYKFNSVEVVFEEEAEEADGLAAFGALHKISYQQFPYQTEDYRMLIARSLELFEIIPSEIDGAKFNIKQELHKIYGMSASELAKLGFALFFSSDDGTVSKDNILNAEISRELKDLAHNYDIDRVLDRISIDYQGFRSEVGEEVDGTEQYNFNPLRKYPVVRTEKNNLAIAPITKLLVEKLSSGHFFTLMDEFKVGKGTNIFLDFFGKEIFERYVGKLLENYFKASEIIPEFDYTIGRNTLRSSDWIIIQVPVAILIECKTSGLNIRSKTSSSRQTVQSDVHKTFMSAMSQMNRFESDARSGNTQKSYFDEVTSYLYVAITFDQVTSVLFNRLFKLSLEAAGYNYNKCFAFNISDLESIEGLLGECSFMEVLNGLRKDMKQMHWSTYDLIRKAYRERGVTQKYNSHLFKLYQDFQDEWLKPLT